MRRNRTRLALIAVGLGSMLPAVVAAEVKVVGTLTTYASIAAEIGGDRVETYAIADPHQDAHFVKPKPSLALMLRDADLFITTGLDLELWAPTLVDKSGNRRIRDGQPGYVAAAQGVPKLDVPESPSREQGDVHLYGNPHIHTSPLNAKIIAGNIAAGLKRVDPDGTETYERNLADFRRRIDVALFGEELVELLGSGALGPLAREGMLILFLEERRYEDAPLVERLGGWMKRALPLRDRKLIAYHKNWIYFTDLFGLEIVDYVEPKPGIPPTPRHVHELIQLIESEDVGVILTASYFDPRKPAKIAERTGAEVVVVPLATGAEVTAGYFDLVSLWIDRLLDAYGS